MAAAKAGMQQHTGKSISMQCSNGQDLGPVSLRTSEEGKGIRIGAFVRLGEQDRCGSNGQAQVLQRHGSCVVQLDVAAVQLALCKRHLRLLGQLHLHADWVVYSSYLSFFCC